MRGVALRIRRSLFAVKDIIGADVNTECINLRASPCHIERAQAVYAKGFVCTVFRIVNPDKSGTINHDVRAHRFQYLFYRSRIGALDFLMTESEDFITAGFHQDIYEIRPQLAHPTDDSDARHVYVLSRGSLRRNNSLQARCFSRASSLVSKIVVG